MDLKELSSTQIARGIVFLELEIDYLLQSALSLKTHYLRGLATFPEILMLEEQNRKDLEEAKKIWYRIALFQGIIPFFPNHAPQTGFDEH